MELFNCKENEELYVRLFAESFLKKSVNPPISIEQVKTRVRNMLIFHARNNISLPASHSLEEMLGFDRELWKEYIENNIKAKANANGI